MQARTRRPSPALVVAIVALIVALTGSAYAAIKLPKNSVGSRQLKSKAVTTGKIAKNAITGIKVRKGTLTGEDINLSQLGTVPTAASADHAGSASALVDSEGKLHSAGCPAGTTLIRGVCYDLALNPPAKDVEHAADACAAKGGYLPTTMQLFSVRGVINLGRASEPPNFAVSDSYFANPTTGDHFSAMTVDGSGTISIITNKTETRYICAYPLVR
jgi:hypothetical protein